MEAPSPAELREINTLAERLAAHSRAYPLETYLAPLNRADIEDALIASLATNRPAPLPVPQYEKPPEDAVAAAVELGAALGKGSSSWFERVADDVQQRVRMLTFLQDRRAEVIEKVSTLRYGLPSDRLIAKAEHLAAVTEEDHDGVHPPRLDSSQVARRMERCLAALHAEDWAVAVDRRMSARLSVSGERRLVRIRDQESFTSVEVERLIVHEIGTHVLRVINGAEQPLVPLRLGCGDYLATEEGLAAWHEQRFGLLDRATLRRYALRLLGVQYCRSNDAATAFRMLANRTAPKEAAAIVLRARRGTIDLEAPGAYVKDHTYLSGFVAVNELLEADPTVYPLLLAGKCSISQLEDMSALEQAGLLKPAVLRPEDVALTLA